ncbi:glycoside hydrolase family 13 protein [Actinospica sp. MGRD01-02]|uniref:Glycoside hydrolase family 13 protein n=1 Tax=Actinospica acidithermotolerans TaxID=2828514 RepID=A0A941E6W7_9ACTN|nr:glycoside hydrolase family 13 protein [Actinospica acidithermotolerans]MBR7826206.1 glycoside hydrolase family 13 protein [Actinospica acidithermotolerans]
MALQWWRDAVTYQVYVRSFADGNGDGVGDLGGIRSRLAYLADLGIDAIWLNPWYPSPMADGGYDVSDYRDIDPDFGTLAEADALIAEAHALGIRIIIDIVPNHVSDQHAWFQAALKAGPRSPERSRFWFRPGRGPGGDEPPNNWVSHFGGPAWSRVVEPDGSPGQWYLHLFADAQPDLNWEQPEVREEHLSILRFWFDRGADGIRIDSAAILVKDPFLADLDPEAPQDAPHPYTDRDGIHEIYQEWRRVADSYPEPKALIGEVWMPDPQRFAMYLRPNEIHTAFNLSFLCCPWDPAELRKVIDETIAAHQPVGAPATWVLSNHDVTRHVSRYGRDDTSFAFATRSFETPVDLELGTRRARAAALLSLSLPGSAYIYQGEELGLWEVEDIPDGHKHDQMFFRTNGADPGRDGCRVPLPWSGDQPPFGFSPAGASAQPWLAEQPADWRRMTVEAQTGDPASMLELYRSALRIRRATAGLRTDREALRWLPADPEVLAYRRGDDFACVVNFGPHDAPLPEYEEVLLGSGPLAQDGRLPSDTAVWLRLN